MGLAEEDDVLVVVSPVVLNRDRGVLFGELVDLLAQPVGMIDDLLGDEVRIEDLQVLVGDDERDAVASGRKLRVTSSRITRSP